MNDGWNALNYKKIQRKYQNNIGKQLITSLEEYANLRDKNIIDVGSGDGYLTRFLGNKVGIRGSITGIDSSAAMVTLAENKESMKNVEYRHGDGVNTLGEYKRSADIVFSNATLHWLGSYERLKIFFENAHIALKPKGIVSCRFSLFDHGQLGKCFLEEKIKDFLNNSTIRIRKSVFEFKETVKLITDQDLEILYCKQHWFKLFKRKIDNFNWIIYSQPILDYIKKEDYKDFVSFFRNEWDKNKVEIKGHHGIFIVKK